MMVRPTVRRERRKAKRGGLEVKKPSQGLLAWRYDCWCGIGAYSFDGPLTIRDSKGHDVSRAERVIYCDGGFHNPCPLCEKPAIEHTGERKEEMFYEAVCPEGAP